MAGAIPQRPNAPTMGATPGQVQATMSASMENSFLVATVAERLGMHVRTGQRSDPAEFFNLCLALARGIDYAVTNNEVPNRAQDLPLLLKQVYQRKNECILQAAIMVLMISVKNACKSGWFLVKDADELTNLANEIERSFCNTGDINIEPSNPQIISNVMSRFFPRMKMGCVFASLEVKPGYGIFVVDFHIPKNEVSIAQEKFWLFVAQTDDISTSSCIISPPQVSFLLNGRAVERRTNVSMDNSPQFPTNVTGMLKYGTNLLQAVGNFSGNYIITIAFMSVISSSDIPVLQDYVQPLASALESDSEIIEGPSRISLNCPISLRRIRTPVKGHLCKHHQCFDYENFIEINSRRPSWRCPHCNQSVCYTDIRIDQNMAKVLREVGKNVADVIISGDGSWKPVQESDDHTDLHDNSLNYRKDGSEQCESTMFSNTQTNVVDLTMERIDENDAMDTYETEDRKPFHDIPHDYSLPRNLTIPPVSNASEAVQNTVPQMDDDFWSGILFPGATPNGSAAPSISGPPSANFTVTPVLTDAVSPAPNRQPVDAHLATQATNSLWQNQIPIPNNLQLQPTQVGNSIVNSDTGRSSIPRHVNRTPIAIQALPAQTQTPNSRQRPRTSLNSLVPNGASPVTSQTPMASLPNGLNVVSGEAERQQQFSRSHMNSLPTSDMASSSMQHHSMSQNWDHQDRPHIPSESFRQIVGLPATSLTQGTYRGSSGLPPELQNPHHQQSPNQWVPQSMSQPTMVRPSSHFPPGQIQQVGTQGVGGQATGSMPNSYSRFMATTQRMSQVARPLPSVPVQLQAPRTGSSFPMTADGLRASMGEQRGVSMGGMVQSISGADDLVEFPSDQNWQPTGRMRGSLSGRAYSAAFNQFVIQPAQSTQAARASDLNTPTRVPSQLQALLANNLNVHGMPR